MSSKNQHTEKQEEQHDQNPPSNFGSEGWMTDPFALAPSNNAKSSVNDVGNGQQSSHQEQTYTLPGGTTHYESSG